jgi:hypothetical protein
MPRDLPLTEELVKVPTGHPRQAARLAKREEPPLVKRQRKLLAQRALVLCRGQPQRMADKAYLPASESVASGTTPPK